MTIVLVFDTETTGLVNSRIIQLSFVLYDIEKKEIIFYSQKNNDYILLPEFYNSENINEKWLIDRKPIEDELFSMINKLEEQKENDTKDEYRKKRTCLEENVVNKNIIPFGSTISHRIFDSTLYKYGRDLNTAMNEFVHYFYMADIIAGHNVPFDIKMICNEIIHLLNEKHIKITTEERISYIQLFHELIEHVNDRNNEKTKLVEMFHQIQSIVIDIELVKNKRVVECTMKKSTIICRLRQAFEYKKIYSAGEITRLEGSFDQMWKLYKSPQLLEAHKIIFGQNVNGQLHDSIVDVAVTLRLFIKLYKNIDICNYGSRLNKHHAFLFELINPEDITDSRDFPRQLFFKQKEDQELFYLDPNNHIKQTKETIWKTSENTLREIKKGFKTLLPIKILEMKMNANTDVVAISLPIKEEIVAYSKTNPRRNPRRNKRVL